MIEGKWHKPGSAAQYNAALRLEGEYFTLLIEGGSTLTGKLDDLKVSDRLGNVERKLTLEDGSVFATLDNATIDEHFRKHNIINNFVHYVESHMGWVLVSLVLTVAFSVAFVKWGIPSISKQIAHALPHKTNELIARHTLEFLDEHIFEESKLDAEQIKVITEHFETKLVPLDDKNASIEYKLHFREWDYYGLGIPNALALPSGDIILTDKFVELSESQDEIDSVLLHEMGHILNRHSLEMIIESTIVTTVVMLVVGDSNGLVDMGIGIGSLLVSSNYSRGHEAEADLYAFKQMLVAKIDPIAFSDIMARITLHMEDKDESEQSDEKDSTESDNDFLDYLSSHPRTADRIKLAKEYSKCFQNGLSVCDLDQTKLK